MAAFDHPQGGSDKGFSRHRLEPAAAGLPAHVVHGNVTRIDTDDIEGIGFCPAAS